MWGLQSGMEKHRRGHGKIRARGRIIESPPCESHEGGLQADAVKGRRGRHPAGSHAAARCGRHDDLGRAGIGFKDLHTTQSSLEEIFVDLVRQER